MPLIFLRIAGDWISRSGSSASPPAFGDRKFDSVTPTNRILLAFSMSLASLLRGQIEVGFPPHILPLGPPQAELGCHSCVWTPRWTQGVFLQTRAMWSGAFVCPAARLSRRSKPSPIRRREENERRASMSAVNSRRSRLCISTWMAPHAGLLGFTAGCGRASAGRQFERVRLIE